jgi:predicted ATPase
VVMVFEDAHWIDPSSRELLDLTVERVRSAVSTAGFRVSSGFPGLLLRSGSGSRCGSYRAPLR